MKFKYCPNCGEPVHHGRTDPPDEVSCDNCEMYVSPISQSGKAAMPFGARHPIQCVECKGFVQLFGFHRGEYGDGVAVSCKCESLSAIPSQLSEAELPEQWEMLHDVQKYEREDQEA